MLKTKKGGFIIFDYRKCPLATPGKPIPADYEKESENGKKPFFFCPTEGCGTTLGEMRGFPMIYSPGFYTEDKALEAAEEWENNGREHANKAADAALQSMQKLWGND